MKKIDLTKTGGFPMKQKALAYLQDAHFEILTAIIGHFGLANTGNFIISGCEIDGANITPGMMYIDGTLCPFAGQVGDLTTKIAKIETTETAAFKNGTNPVVYFDYTAAENSAGVELSDFTRLPQVPELENVVPHWTNITGKPNVVIDPAVAPAPSLIDRIIKLEEKNAVFQAGGGMVLWNKPANLIPTGWAEVVNWKGRIPVGVDDSIDGTGAFVNPEFSPMPPPNVGDVKTPGRVGGSKKQTLVEDNIPLHSFSYTGSVGTGNHDDTPGGGTPHYGPGTLQTASYGKLNNDAINLLNPFRTVLFIEYIG